MQSCAVALGKYGIRCNALLPGTIRTQLNDEDMGDERKRRYMEGRIPLGRLGQTKDLAGPAVFLACDSLSGYVVSFFFIMILVIQFFFRVTLIWNALNRLVHRFLLTVGFLLISNEAHSTQVN